MNWQIPMAMIDQSSQINDLKYDNERMTQTIADLLTELEKYRQMKCEDCAHSCYGYSTNTATYCLRYERLMDNPHSCSEFKPKESGK